MRGVLTLLVDVAAGMLPVNFAHEATLDLLVPRELREELTASGGEHLQGRATCSEFRRFTTSARILPAS